MIFEYITIRNADGAICISQFSKESLQKHFKKEIEVIYNKIDCNRFRPGIDGSIIRDKYNIGDKPVILFVGQLIPNKGAHLLVDALNHINTVIPDAKLLLVGKTVYPRYQEILKSRIGNNVLIAGVVSEEELPYYYAACDVYATGSLWEGFNLPLVEAQACGKPVVAFNVGPHPEVLENERTGYLVPPGDTIAMADAVKKLLQDNRLKNTMGEEGVAMVRRHFCSIAEE